MSDPTRNTVSLQFIVLDGEDVIALVLLPCHEKAQFLHTLGSATGHGLALRNLSATRAINIFLMKLLTASLPLLLQALDNVNGPSNVGVVGAVVGFRAFRVLHVSEESRRAGERFGVNQAGSTSQVEIGMGSMVWRSSGRYHDLGRRGPESSGRMTLKQRLGRTDSRLRGRRAKSLGWWGMISAGRSSVTLPPPLRWPLVVMNVLHLARHPLLLVA